MVAAVQDRRARQIGEEPESGDADQYPALDGGPRRYAAPALCAQRGAVGALNVERKSRRHQRVTSDIRMRTASACPGKPSASASAMMCAASCSSCRREYATTLMRFTKSYTPNGETYRAVAPVGNTWDGPAT